MAGEYKPETRQNSFPVIETEFLPPWPAPHPAAALTLVHTVARNS